MIRKLFNPSIRSVRAPAAFAAACLLALSVDATDLSQPVRVSPDGRYLMQPDGSPFFWLADTGWSIFQRLDREGAEQYLKDRASKGYNVIQAVAYGGPADSVSAPNRYGNLPLIKGDPTKPNPKYFEHVDWVVDRAASHGIRIAMLPVWGASVIGGWVGPGLHLLDTKSAEAYGRWLGERYRNKGVMWIFGGDTNPMGVSSFAFEKSKQDLTIIDYRPIYDALAKGLAAGEKRAPFITYHITCCAWGGTAVPRTSLYLGKRSWLTMNMLQSSHFRDPASVMKLIGVDFAWDGTYNYEPITAEYRSTPVRPVVDGEPRYEDLAVDVESDPKVIEAKGYWKAYDTRNAAYHSVFSGAAGHTYGNHSVWQFYDPAHYPPTQAARSDLPWQQAILRPGAGQMQYVKALMLSRPYFTRIPDQSLIVGDSFKGESHISATRDRSGSYAMAYVPKGQAVTLDLSLISGSRAVAWWFDPRNGAATRIDGDLETTGPKTFTPPSSGAEDDWILVIDEASKAFSAPGKTG